MSPLFLLLSFSAALLVVVPLAAAQTYTLPAGLNASITAFFVNLALHPPLNLSMINPMPHTYSFSNPTVSKGAADPFSRSVLTSSGRLLGQQISGTGITVFNGIPYALPPVGALRFRSPVAFPGNASFTVNATTQQSWCLQIGPLDLTSNVTRVQRPLVGSEDCLYLNVWTPANLSIAVAPVLTTTACHGLMPPTTSCW
jgi:hypothetical protein